ncbi:nucleophile aminohydrolase [Lentinula aciculospora]|uniref:Glutathione hydrolase n=1 Tax=Lentinula aciculospora TaxID=153920 RepID=A0A9W9ALM0_9AGAR|nr:nucleophile aminohydrolase [Lentinula aciculospora]
MAPKTAFELPLPVPSATPVSHTSRRVNRILLALIFVFASCLGLLSTRSNSYYISGTSDIHFKPRLRNPSYLIEAQNGAVASENVRCSEMGVQIMKEGGNAVDAAIASCMCIGVVNMFSAGLGGGGFLTVRVPPSSSDVSSKVFVVDFRETAPSLANETMFPAGGNSSQFGGLAVGVPGLVRGLAEAHRRWGKLPWKQVIEPSAELALGWEVDVELARRIPFYPDLMLNDPDWSPIFAPHGALLKKGELIRRLNLSRTLSIIASEGPESFYKGVIADSLVRKIQATGGIVSNADLENYTVNVYSALEGHYLGKKIYVPRAPTCGPVLLHMLNILEKYDFNQTTGLNVHRLVETMKFGFAARTHISDPAFRNDTETIHEIHTKAYANAIRENLTDDRTHAAQYYNPLFDMPEDHGTVKPTIIQNNDDVLKSVICQSHISVVDKDGMAVALTDTVNTVFASQVLDPDTGIILNNEMNDFSVPGTPNAFGLWPSPYNYPQPGKRPLSSTVPVIIENNDGSFYIAVGGAGGSLIFTAILQVFLHLLQGMDLLESVGHGRLHDQIYPPITVADNIYPADLLDALRERGHNVTVFDINRISSVINIVVQQDNGTIFAVSDARKNGIAAGY